MRRDGGRLLSGCRRVRVRRESLGWQVAVFLGVVAVPAMLLHAQEGNQTEWKAATPSYTLAFPRDHASHPDYKIEWWYYTGNLLTSDARRFGYQLTFFRIGVDPNPINPSRWAVRDLYMAHLAVTDVDGQTHQVAERLNRDGVGWAGASTETLHVWNENWSILLDGDTHILRATTDDRMVRLDLQLEPLKAAVLHGDAGYSRKGAAAGNASHYYSLTRLRTSGTLQLNGATLNVEGQSWMDHEFGTSFLEPSQVGWDWFSIQLNDDTDVMVYVFRHPDGSIDPHSSGTVVGTSGITRLGAGDYQLVPGRVWESPTSGAAYPVEWKIEIPQSDLVLNVAAAVDAQELHTDRSTGVIYWEGTIDVTGTRAGKQVWGSGYLEMTGYAGRPMSEFFR